jgi:hypothetical protein
MINAERMTGPTKRENLTRLIDGNAGWSPVTGYMHPGYAASLAEFGSPLELQRCEGWLLERDITGTGSKDAMGCYPLFACRDWSQLERDLVDLEGKLVCVTIVADPFGNHDRQLLERCFDTVSVIKEHYAADLTAPADAIVSKHNRSYALKALNHVKVQVCQKPIELLDEWVLLYHSLIERHAIRGIRAFSRKSFEKQLAVPGLVALRAERERVAVGIDLYYIQGDTAYAHLLACSPQGYRLRASYALKWYAILHFTGRVRWIDWGGGAGITARDADGLVAFKRGWATCTRPAYFCTKILDNLKYREIVRARGLGHSGYFPTYREGEFS